MEKQELIEKINSALADEFEVEESVITPEAPIKETLELDSLSLVDLVALIESNFGIKIAGSEVSNIKTFASLYDFVFDKVLARGEEIFSLIPQRPPMTMVDTLYSADETAGETGLTVLKDNVFCLGGQLIEPGLIEHSAQSAAAFAGYRYYLVGEKPHIGLIGEIKSFRIDRLPKEGESLRTRVEVEGEAMGMSLVRTETSVGGERIAGGLIKIFIVD